MSATPPRLAQQRGLDRAQLLAHLHATRTARQHRPSINQRITDHLNAHDGYVAFSGGKDSLTCLHLALSIDRNIPVAFFDSGFEFPETYTYLDTISNHLNVTISWYPAAMTTLDALITSGAWDHRAPNQTTPPLHYQLITEPAGRAHDDHGPGELWGVRAAESRGRAAMYARALRTELQHCPGPACCPIPTAADPSARRRHGGRVARNDGTVAYGPIWDWHDDDVWGYLTHHQLPINPVYAKLRQLGAPSHALRISHLLDGSHLEQGRLTWLRRGWPDVYADLVRVLPRVAEFI